MSNADAADPDRLIKQGKLDEGLQALQDRVRSNPADAADRLFLFQLLAVLGQWERAMTQLNVVAEMNPDALLMAQACRPALQCEQFREQVFAGLRTPLIFGEPAGWISSLVQAANHVAKGEFDAALKQRDLAFDAAPAEAGTVNGEPFEWIADADTRLGPVLEVLIDGKYYWAPFANITTIEIEKPTDLRDVVWTAANFTWKNGGTTVGMIPTRYPATTSSEDAGLRMARRTEWQEPAEGHFLGVGQRMLATDEKEYPLFEITRIEIGPQPEPVADEAERTGDPEPQTGDQVG